ncbi:hypothetical protein FRC01_006080, partial [Tulasnella sp. 417]
MACKLFMSMCDMPGLSSLKPLGSILVIICEHVSVLQENNEAAVTLAERVARVAQVLINSKGSAVRGSYFREIKALEDVLCKIATTVEALRQRKAWWKRKLSPKTVNYALNQLSSDLDFVLQLFV